MPKVRDRLDYPHFHEIHEEIVSVFTDTLKNVGFAFNIQGSNKGKPAQYKPERTEAIQCPYFRVFLNSFTEDTTSAKKRSMNHNRVVNKNEHIATIDNAPINYVVGYLVEIVTDRYEDYIRSLESIAFNVLPMGDIDVLINKCTENEQVCRLKYQFSNHQNFEDGDKYRSRFNFDVFSSVSQNSIETLKTIKSVDVKDCINFYFEEENYTSGE